MKKPAYALGAPDQQRLKIARAKIEGVLKEHDIAGVVVLHTPGMAEFFYDITPSYSCMSFDERAGALRLRSKLADYGGDKEKQMRSRAATANMVRSLSENLRRAGDMFEEMADVVDRALQAEHTDAVHTPDPMEGNKQ